MTREEMDAAICAVIGGSGQVGEAMHGAFRAGMMAAAGIADGFKWWDETGVSPDMQNEAIARAIRAAAGEAK